MVGAEALRVQSPKALSYRAELRIDLLEHSTRTTAWSRLSTTNNFYFAAWNISSLLLISTKSYYADHTEPWRMH